MQHHCGAFNVHIFRQMSKSRSLVCVFESKPELGEGAKKEAGVGFGGGGWWLPSVRDSSGCQAQDSTKKMEDTSSPVSCRSALTAPALNYSVSAAPVQLRSIPPPPFRLPAGRCSSSACARQDECRGGKWGGKWGQGGWSPQ